MDIKNFKAFKLFERGDDDDIEMGPTLKMELGEDGRWHYKDQGSNSNCDYILAVPSGEVVIIEDANILKKVVDKKLAYYVYSFKGHVLNCYSCRDEELDDVKNYIRTLRKDENVDPKVLSVCKEFREEMKKVLKKNHVIAYIHDLNGINYYYLIIPQLIINKPYYKQKNSEMVDVLNIMRDKHPKGVFAFTDRMSRRDVKYYGLPDTYDESGNIKKSGPKLESPKPKMKKDIMEICKELREDVGVVTKKSYTIEHSSTKIRQSWSKLKDFYYFNIPPKDISLFDSLGKTKVEFLIYSYNQKYPYAKVGWLNDLEEYPTLQLQSGIYVMEKS